jgi:hypothetical protein
MRQLGQLETAVMDRLWTWGRPVSVREVLEDLVRERPLAPFSALRSVFSIEVDWLWAALWATIFANEH